MRAKLFLPVLAMALTGCNWEDMADSGRFSSDFHYAYPLQAGGRLSVESFNGAVEITGWDRDTVDISGTKFGPTQQAADGLRIEIDNAPDSVSVRAVQPSDRRNHQGARFVIKVPRSAALARIVTSNAGIHTQDASGPARLKTSNGSIRVQALRGTLDAQTSNSPVDLDDIDGDVTVHNSNGHVHVQGLRGALIAETSNAGVTAKLERADRPVRVDTSNGNVDLTLPANHAGGVRAETRNSGITLRAPAPLNARVTARTSNSSISSDFEMTIRGDVGKDHMDGTIGNGGAQIDLTTSNGGIRLLRIGSGY